MKGLMQKKKEINSQKLVVLLSKGEFGRKISFFFFFPTSWGCGMRGDLRRRVGKTQLLSGDVLDKLKRLEFG